MVRSSGVLVYRVNNNVLEVLLCHFKGLYWKDINIGAWSLSKGEIDSNEKAIECALREFKEETNLEIKTPL